MQHVSVDLWAINLQVASPDLHSQLARTEHRMADAASRGVHLLVLPAQSAVAGGASVLEAAGIPVGMCRAIRHGQAEAELRPAQWQAGHLRVIAA